MGVGGKRTAPPEDCGGPLTFMQRRKSVGWEIHEQLWQMAEDVGAGEIEVARARLEEILLLREWLMLERFDRRAVNRRLKQYADGDKQWLYK